MARFTNTAVIRSVATICVLASTSHAQVLMTLDEAGLRKEPEYAPAHEGKPVVVTGQVSTKPLHVLDYVHVAIQDHGVGLILEGKGDQFDQLSAGDWVEARGKVGRRGGLPVVVVSKVFTVSGGAAPIPKAVPVEDLHTFQHTGQLVTTEGRVVGQGENAGGAFLLLGPQDNPLKVFLPGLSGGRFRHVSRGDGVRVTGIAYQYCPNPPYNRHFELLIGGESAIARFSYGWLHDLWSWKQWLALLIVPALYWWRREHLARVQRETLRTMYGLGEEILEASSAPEIAGRIEAVVPQVLRVTAVRLYLYDRGSNALNLVPPPASEGTAPDPRAAPIILDAPAGPVQTSAANCFRERNLIAIADTRRGVRLSGDKGQRSYLFVPMMAQGEAVGVFQIESERHRNFTPDAMAAAQHLANQVGAAAKLLQQRSFREQLSRTEKLAAVGRLISGVVNDLQTPLAAISSMAESALENYSISVKDKNSALGHELLVIASESRRASAIVSRLVSFAQAEETQAEPVELNQLLRSLIRFRDREWKACGIQLRNLLKDEPLFVMGSQGQLEQVFLNLFVHAEQSLQDAAEKKITVRADVLAKRVFIELSYTDGGGFASRGASNAQLPEGEVSALGLDVCGSILAGHGGEIRIAHTPGRESAFEIELPWLPMDQAVEHAVETREEGNRRWTAMILEPEEWVGKRLLEMVSARGYRVVPVTNSDEGLDLVGRMRFDVVMCSTRLEGLNWVEFFDRVRGRVGAFCLLAEAFSHDLSTHFKGEGRCVLLKPIDKSQFDRTFEAIEARLTNADLRAPELESP